MTLHAIKQWQQTARPDASEKDTSLALGIFLEEVAEVLFEFKQTTKDNEDYLVNLSETRHALNRLAFQLKRGRTAVEVDGSRENLVKELADVVVTAVGLGHVLQLNVPLACERVNQSNWSKFVDGAPVYDDDGKVIKGPGYVKADMTGCY